MHLSGKASGKVVTGDGVEIVVTVDIMVLKTKIMANSGQINRPEMYRE